MNKSDHNYLVNGCFTIPEIYLSSKLEYHKVSFGNNDIVGHHGNSYDATNLSYAIGLLIGWFMRNSGINLDEVNGNVLVKFF